MTTSAFRGRREDPRLLTGQGRYTNDMNLPGQLHAAFRRSDRAHARLRSIDKTAAETVPGVVAVLVGADLPADAFHTCRLSRLSGAAAGSPCWCRSVRSSRVTASASWARSSRW
jgi:CO/xanthine dehydrogenase Mo-binding subunit